MTTEQYSIGYEEGYQAGWNEAMEAKPAQKQEPVAWYRDEDGIRIYYESAVWDDATPLYTSPQPAQQATVSEGRALKLAMAEENDKRLEAQQATVNKYCCHLCFNKSGQMFLDRMILCPECGNKRCPKATYHELPCTNSNEPGQPGSIYASPPASKPLAYAELMALAKKSGLGPENVSGLLQARLEIYGRAIEAKLREKNEHREKNA